ncbi:MAG: response regulator [Bilophila sp.]
MARFETGVLGQAEYIAYAPILHTNWILLSVIPESVALAPLMRTIWQGVFFVLIGSALVFAMGYLLSSREIVTPLSQLENAAKRLAAGDLTTRIPEKATSHEILSLERTFNSMVSQLGTSIEKEIAAGLARSYAEDASKAKSDFLARMSHEIRTPMNAILGLTHLALHEQPDEKQRTFLLKIQRAGKSMLALINDILDFSKIEAGMLKLEVRPFSLQEVVKTLDDLFSSAAMEKGLFFRVASDDNVPDQLMGDSLRLTQILMNLCNNALKFTQQGGVTVHMSVSELSEAACTLTVSVTDTGVGIPKEVQHTLFNEFTQADSSTTRQFGGTGLGLAICKLLSECMSGGVMLESSSDAGSTFTVIIPFDRVPLKDACTLASTTESPATFDIPASTRILVAEDNDINQEIITALLEYKGLACRMVSNGNEALQALSEEPFDIVLMDIQMPEMDGYTATTVLRSQGFTMPVLAMTANALDTDKQKCYDAGMNAHIAKPIEPEDLYAQIALWCKA